MIVLTPFWLPRIREGLKKVIFITFFRGGGGSAGAKPSITVISKKSSSYFLKVHNELSKVK